MAKKSYTAEERRAYKKGANAQYRRDHPLVRYELVAHDTYYNADGSFNSRVINSESKELFMSKKMATTAARIRNATFRDSNSKVMDQVKKKKVGFINITRNFFVRKVAKPYRVYKDKIDG